MWFVATLSESKEHSVITECPVGEEVEGMRKNILNYEYS